jgi:hypothetical protein
MGIQLSGGETPRTETPRLGSKTTFILTLNHLPESGPYCRGDIQHTF